MNEREVGKIEIYKMPKDEVARMWGMKKVIVIPVVAGALCAISTGFEKYTSPHRKRCFNVSFNVVWAFLERHFWKVYLTLEATR